MPCSPEMKGCRKECLHRQMVREYYDQRDARDALRESEAYMQYEDEDFDAKITRVLFKDWLIGYWR